MKKIVLLFLPQVLVCVLYAQQPASGFNTGWNADPFDHNIFIQNGGQLASIPGGDKILYHINFSAIDMYFTANGMMYAHQEENPEFAGLSPEKIKEKMEEREASGDQSDEDAVTPKMDYLNLDWVGANPNPIITAEEKQSYYYTYYAGGKNIVVNVYKKLVYHNLYPGIDAEYSFSTDNAKRGIQRALIVNPGADISVVKLKYTGATGLKLDSAGNVVISTPMGNFIDHVAVSYTHEGENIATGYNVNGNEETFSVNGQNGNRNRRHTFVTPTWSSNPLSPPGGALYDIALRVDYDNSGNVYVYGGTHPLQLTKLNSLGAILWTANMVITGPIIWFVGSMATAPAGQCYVLGPPKDIYEYSTSGALLRWFNDDTSFIVSEVWQIRCIKSNAELLIGEGQSQQFLLLDSNIHFPTAVIDSNHGSNAGNRSGPSRCIDIDLLALDPAGTSAYMNMETKTAGIDSLVRIPIPFPTTPAAMVYGWAVTGVNDPGDFKEDIANKYWYRSQTPAANITNVYNGLAASPNYLYMYNGLTVTAMKKTTGAIVGSILPPTGADITLPGTGGWGGIACVDNCDDVYVGVGDSVVTYVFNGATFNKSPVQPSIFVGDTVKDVELGAVSGNGPATRYTLYACGQGFVSSTQVTPTALCDVPLPIQLMYFNCVPATNGIVLSWATQTQVNNKYFTLERSSDGINFSPITSVPGAGNSSFITKYNYTDLDPQNGTNYYRLSQTDYDGTTVYFNTTACEEGNDVPLVYPNPSGGEFSVQLPSRDTLALSTLNLYDLLGRKVYSQTMQNQKIINIAVPSLASGLYVLSITTIEKTYVNKVLIRK